MDLGQTAVIFYTQANYYSSVCGHRLEGGAVPRGSRGEMVLSCEMLRKRADRADAVRGMHCPSDTRHPPEDLRQKPHLGRSSFNVENVCAIVFKRIVLSPTKNESRHY